jgi:hypothetical protein
VRTTRIQALLPLAAIVMAVTLAELILAAGDIRGSQADQSQSSIYALAIDADPSRRPANTATSFGSIQTCAETTRGDTLEVDVVVDSVPADRPMTGFQFDIVYDPEIVFVADWQGGLMLAGDGDWIPIDALTDPVPDWDGRFTIAIADFSEKRETGPGTLARVTLEAVNSGATPVEVGGEILILDDQNEVIPVDNLGQAIITVDQSCQQAEVAPVPTVELQPKGTPSTRPLPTISVTVPPEELTPQPEATLPPPSPPPSPPTSPSPLASPSPAPIGTSTPSPSASPSLVTPEASPSPSGALSVDGDSGSDGFPYWVLAPIAAGAVALGAGGYLLRRRLMSKRAQG